VARTVFAMQTPVVTGVGHETDFTIVDFVSDLRAPTPSAAAEVCTPDRLEEMEKLLLMQSKLRGSMNSYLKNNRIKVNALASSTVLRSLTSLINERRLALDSMTDKMTQLVQNRTLVERQRLHCREESMQRTLENQVQKGRMQLSVCAGKLDAFAPLKVLARGYSLSFNREGRVVQSITAVNLQEEMTVQVSDGKIHCRVESVEQE
jgi:exodeoxyribonuclease VII large subunit